MLGFVALTQPTRVEIAFSKAKTIAVLKFDQQENGDRTMKMIIHDRIV